MATVLGTGFATSDFSYDPNLSPNNQSFSAAVLAVVRRNPSVGTAFYGFANPSAKVSTTGTNGTSTLAMRADAAPPIDLAMSPTWTGVHTFHNASTTPIIIDPPAGGDAIFVSGAGVALIEISDATEPVYRLTCGSLSFDIGMVPSECFVRSNNAVPIVLQTNGAQRVVIDQNGACTIEQPSTGAALSITGTSGYNTLNVVQYGASAGVNIQANGGGSAAALSVSCSSGTQLNAISVNNGLNQWLQYMGGADSIYRFWSSAAGTDVLQLGPDGGVTVAAPATGTIACNILSGTGAPALYLAGQANSETLRMAGNAAYISAYNNSLSQRSGYLQFNTNSSVVLAAESNGTGSLEFVTNGAGRMTIDTSGEVSIFNVATGGIALSIGGGTSARPLDISGVGNASYAQWNRNGSRVGYVGSADSLVSGAASTDFAISAIGGLWLGYNNTNGGVYIGTAGNITVEAPGSGASLSVNALSGQAGVQVAGTGAAAFYQTVVGAVALQMNSAGANWGMVQNDAANLFSLAIGSGGVGTRGTPMLQWGTASVTGHGPVAGALVDMTPDSGSFTGTCTNGVNYTPITITWRRSGNLVGMTIPAFSGTSNSSSFALTGSIPASIIPATSPKWSAVNLLVNNGSLANGGIVSVATGTITFGFGLAASVWTTSGQKAVSSAIAFAYSLD